MTTQVRLRPAIWRLAASHASGWLAVVLFVTMTGHIVAQGHDGLATTLGVSGAVVLWAFALPLLLRSHVNPAGELTPNTIPAHLALSSGSAAVGLLAATVLVFALTGLLAAELTAAASVLAVATGSASSGRLLIGTMTAFGVLIAALWPTARTGPYAGAAGGGLFVAVLIALLTGLTLLAYHDGPGALVSVPALADIATLELGLLEKRIADPATFRPYAVPFLRTDALNFAGLIGILSFGLAMMATPLPQRDFGSRHLRSLSTRAALLMTSVLILLPPLAAAAKRALLTWSSSGIRVPTLPDWTVAYRDTGALKICGSASLDTLALAKQCGRGVGSQGVLRWNDVVFNPDSLLIAAFDAGGSGGTMMMLTIAAFIAVLTVWTTARVLRLVSRSVESTAWMGNAISLGVVLTALLVAYANPTDALTLVIGSASLAAAALAPSLLATVALPNRLPRFAAILAISGGALLTLGLLTATRYAPVALFQLTHDLMHTQPSVSRKLATLNETFITAPPGAGRDALQVQGEKLARDNLNWFGLKPQSAGILGMGLGVVILAVGALIASALRLRLRH